MTKKNLLLFAGVVAIIIFATATVILAVTVKSMVIFLELAEYIKTYSSFAFGGSSS
jgi:hypothetical protein